MISKIIGTTKTVRERKTERESGEGILLTMLIMIVITTPTILLLI